MTLKVNPVTLTSYGQAPLGLRVQAPFGARVLSFVCCALNDGFGPQSGLVQRGVLYAAAWGSENRPTGLSPVGKPYNRLMDKPLWGLRVDGPMGRRFLRSLSLTRLWREGCGGAPLNYRRRPLMKKPYNRPAGEGGRRLAVRTAMEHPIGALPVHPFPLRGTSPQGETRK